MGALLCFDKTNIRYVTATHSADDQEPAASTDEPGMRIPREFIDLLGLFYDVAHERGVLTAEQSVFELRIAAGRAAADAVAIAAEHTDGELDLSNALALFVERFPAEALRDALVTDAQVEPIAALLGEMARRDPIL